MLLAALFVLGPVGLYLLLCALPPRAARRGLVVAGALLLVLGLAWALALPPFTGEPFADGFLVAALTVWALAWALAALLNLVRARLAGRGRLVYPLAVAAVLAVMLVTVLPYLGL